MQWHHFIHIPGNDDEPLPEGGDETLFELFEGATSAAANYDIALSATAEGGTGGTGGTDSQTDVGLETWALTYFDDYMPEIEAWYSEVLQAEADWLQRTYAAEAQGDFSDQPLFVPEVPIVPGIGVEVIKKVFAANPAAGVMLAILFLAAYYGANALKEWLKRKIENKLCCDDLIQAVKDLQYNNDELHLSGSDAVIHLKGKFAQKANT